MRPQSFSPSRRLTPHTVYSGLFHPESTLGILPSGPFSTPSAVRSFERRSPPDVSHALPKQLVLRLRGLVHSMQPARHVQVIHPTILRLPSWDFSPLRFLTLRRRLFRATYRLQHALYGTTAPLLHFLVATFTLIVTLVLQGFFAEGCSSSLSSRAQPPWSFSPQSTTLRRKPSCW